jgi:hypothetical protein
MAAPRPWAKRADQERVGVGQAADQRRAGEHEQARDQHPPAPEQIGHPAAEEQETAVGEDVAVDHPLQALLAEAEIARDWGFALIRRASLSGIDFVACSRWC